VLDGSGQAPQYHEARLFEGVEDLEHKVGTVWLTLTCLTAWLPIAV
jgi:hypothetical protein